MRDLNALLEEIQRLWPVARGSLAEVAKPCVRDGCAACARGERHLAFHFTFRRNGKSRCLYVPRELVPTLRRALEGGRRIEEWLVESGETLILAHRHERRAATKKRRRPKS